MLGIQGYDGIGGTSKQPLQIEIALPALLLTLLALGSLLQGTCVPSLVLEGDSDALRERG